MKIFVKTSTNRKSAWTIAIDSDAFENLVDNYWPLEDTINGDEYWNFKLALREAGTRIDYHIDDSRVFVVSRNRQINLDRVAAQRDLEATREFYADYDIDTIESPALRFSNFQRVENDFVAHRGRLDIVVAADRASDFQAELTELLNKYHVSRVNKPDIDVDAAIATIAEAA